jgi:hypothetical protein
VAGRDRVGSEFLGERVGPTPSSDSVRLVIIATTRVNRWYRNIFRVTLGRGGFHEVGGADQSGVE